MIVVKLPAAIHTAFNPVVYEFEGTTGVHVDAKIVVTHLDGSTDSQDISINFYAPVVSVDLSAQLRAMLGAFNSMQYYVDWQDAKTDARICVRSVAQIGESSDLTHLIGKLLTGFETVVSWEGFPRDVHRLRAEGVAREWAGCGEPPVSCSGEFADFVSVTEPFLHSLGGAPFAASSHASLTFRYFNTGVVAQGNSYTFIPEGIDPAKDLIITGVPEWARTDVDIWRKSLEIWVDKSGIPVGETVNASITVKYKGSINTLNITAESEAFDTKLQLTGVDTLQQGYLLAAVNGYFVGLNTYDNILDVELPIRFNDVVGIAHEGGFYTESLTGLEELGDEIIDGVLFRTFKVLTENPNLNFRI